MIYKRIKIRSAIAIIFVVFYVAYGLKDKHPPITLTPDDAMLAPKAAVMGANALLDQCADLTGKKYIFCKEKQEIDTNLDLLAK